MFVFGEVQDPNMETINLVEDIVRSQIIELVRTWDEKIVQGAYTKQIVQARALATRRGARYLSAEDLIFLIRHDRGKVNRLRTYLSWKDVRKHAKDSGGDGGGEVETLEDGADGKSFCLIVIRICNDDLCLIRQADCEGSEDHDQAPLGDYYHIL